MIKDVLSIDGNNIAHFHTYVSSSETDANYNTRLSVYQALTQEAAGLHASYRNLGIPQLQAEGKTWVIARSRMEIHHYGLWGDGIQVSTFVQPAAGLNCPRYVEGVDDQGRLLFSTMTRWAIIDFRSGRPLRPTEVANRLVPPPESFLKNPNLPNLVAFQESCQEVLATFEPQILYLDTDSNQHVNNLSYTNWLIEALPNAFNDAYKPSLVDVRWIRQCHRGDRILVTVRGADPSEFTKEEPKLFVEIVRLEADGSRTQVFEAWTEWKRRELLV